MFRAYCIAATVIIVVLVVVVVVIVIVTLLHLLSTAISTVRTVIAAVTTTTTTNAVVIFVLSFISRSLHARARPLPQYPFPRKRTTAAAIITFSSRRGVQGIHWSL
jgi:hypothetical protein